jgi:hypothetical protein
MDARAAGLWIAISMLLVVCAYGAYISWHPPYSDYEIKASIVDTWQVEALFTFALLVAVGFLALLSVALGWRSSHLLLRRLSVLAVLLSAASGVLLLYSHISLTERAVQLTGQSFGGFYGLF